MSKFNADPRLPMYNVSPETMTGQPLVHSIVPPMVGSGGGGLPGGRFPFQRSIEDAVKLFKKEYALQPKKRPDDPVELSVIRSRFKKHLGMNDKEFADTVYWMDKHPDVLKAHGVNLINSSATARTAASKNTIKHADVPSGRIHYLQVRSNEPDR